jgi:ribonuclease VapC
MRIRRGAAAERKVWRFLLEDNDFEIAPFDTIQARAALAAFGRYGKGVNSRARLNLADRAAYALAITLDARLLFKGEDFSATDVKSCL